MDRGQLCPASYVPNCVLERYARQMIEVSNQAYHQDASLRDAVDKEYPTHHDHTFWSSSVEMTLVILDVSGFTKISGWLQTNKGTEGPEMMSNFLSQYFHQMLDIVAYFGGDVLKFAGDALLIKFAADPKSVRIASVCAATATMLLDNYVLPGNVPHKLSLHAAVHVGRGEEMTIGGVRGRWEHCVSGGLFKDIGKVLDHADAGTVLVSAAVYDKLQEIEDEELGQGFRLIRVNNKCDTNGSESFGDGIDGTDHFPLKLYRAQLEICTLKCKYPGHEEHAKAGLSLNMSPTSGINRSPSSNSRSNSMYGECSESKEPLRRFNLLKSLPISVTNTYLQEIVKAYCLPNVDSIMSSVFSAEMRDVATIFCLLPPYFADGNCAALYQQIVVAFQIQLSKYDGRLRQFLTDDKGTVLIGCFGLPGTSSIAREMRAVKTAVAFRQKMHMLRKTPGFKDIQIGIASGMVYCGNIGDTSRYVGWIRFFFHLCISYFAEHSSNFLQVFFLFLFAFL